MKVKENLYERRGRPRKFQPGETVEWRLRAPDSLLMELRVCARMGKRSINDEIIARLLQSLNYQSDKPVIKTASAERLISLAVKFEIWLSDMLGLNSEDAGSAVGSCVEDEHLWVWRDGVRELISGKASGYSMRIPENLAEEVRVMARVHQRSLNDEMLTRIMSSFGYYSQRVLDHNEDAQALKVLCIDFEKYIKERIEEVERASLPWDKDK
ncbi:Arc family DNA-binding protein [Yokenella regensburgei]|uniref:Arc family DNA-binding protein n=1 Tax=Yokenella regensburgei TaxID=158877 RepID=UPI003EDACAC7